jgi:hypothetical protein
MKEDALNKLMKPLMENIAALTRQVEDLQRA